MINFKTTIGLEIHVQLATKSKLFCECDNNSEGAESNINVCPVCLGMPGTLPVLNLEAQKMAIKAGLALNCRINQLSKFDRKHYFYPDLPAGYQISQYDKPICSRGYLHIADKKIRINRIHLENDAGKLIHKAGKSLVDLNRAGTPLIEIVTEPDIESPKEAKEFLKELQLIIKYLQISEASMEKGHFRCDANIDVKDNRGKMSEIVELKNLNSFRFIEKALLYEEKRLQREYNNWPKNRRKTTRGYNSIKNITYGQREKEEASDYRYFPDPDLPLINLGTKGKNIIDIDKIQAEINHTPSILRSKLKNGKVSSSLIEKIVTNTDHANYIKDADVVGRELALWITEEVKAQIANHKISYKKYQKNVPIYRLSELLNLIKAGKITQKMAKEIFSKMIISGKSAVCIMKNEMIEMESDATTINKIIDKVIKDNPDEVRRYQNGEKQLLGFFMGIIMKESKGRINPKEATEILTSKMR